MPQTATVSQSVSRPEAWRELRTRFRAEPAARPAEDRIVWFDYAKGMCITLVVMMHSTLGVGDAMGGEGFMHEIVAFARPFRMPDFFLLSGLFLFRMIDRDWRTYLDRKVVHFGYFYLLWLVILTVVKHGAELGSDPNAWAASFADALVSPNPNLWFIYVLPLFFVATKLARAIGMPGWVLWLVAAAMQTFPMHTGWDAIDDYGARYFVFFLTGYLLAPQVFKLAARAREHAAEAAIGLAGWFSFNAVIAFSASPVAGYAKVADVPGVRIAVGLIGAMAVVTAASLLSRANWAGYLRYAGRNSIVLYVSFVLPMAATRILLLKSGLISNIGVVSLIVTVVAVAVPLALHSAVRNTWARFLYERPEALKFERRRDRKALSAPEAVAA
jgi:uncharacterized membrane protein YcfT